MPRVARSILATVLFWISFVVNPMYVAGCLSSEEEEANFGFDETDMLALVQTASAPTTWSFTYGGEEYSVELELEQAPATAMTRSEPQAEGFSARAHACGNKSRTFHKTASACVTRYTSTLPLTGTLTLSRMEGAMLQVVGTAEITGQLEVDGTLLTGGEMLLGFAEHGHVTLSSSDGRTFRLVELSATAFGDEQLDVSYSYWSNND